MLKFNDLNDEGHRHGYDETLKWTQSAPATITHNKHRFKLKKKKKLYRYHHFTAKDETSLIKKLFDAI